MGRISIHRALENAEDAIYQIMDKSGPFIYYAKSEQKKVKEALSYIQKAQKIMDKLIN